MPKDDYFLLVTIETLASTAFDLIIHRESRVKDLKRQIRYYTHIPTQSQHLLLGEVELKDSYTLEDYHIVYGSKIKLVTSMKGGPISYRPVAPSPPIISLMALLKAKSEMLQKKTSSTETLSDDDFDMSESLDSDENEDPDLADIAYFIAHEGKLFEITDFMMRKSSAEILSTFEKEKSDSKLTSSDKNALREQENLKTKEKMANLRKNIEMTAVEKEKFKVFQAAPQPQVPVSFYKEAKNRSFDKRNLSSPLKTNNLKGKKDSLEIEKELFDERDHQQREYRNSLIAMKSSHESANTKTDGKKKNAQNTKMPQNTNNLYDNSPARGNTPLVKEDRRVSLEAPIDGAPKQKIKPKAAVTQEKVVNAEDISRRSMSIKKMDILPKVKATLRSSLSSKLSSRQESSMQSLRLCPAIHSHDDLDNKPIYNAGYNSRAFENFVNSEDFAKRVDTVKSAGPKQLVRNSYPLDSPKNARKAESELKDASLIWNRSTRSSKAEIEELLDFVRRNIEKKERKESIKKNDWKRFSSHNSLTESAWKLNQALPPITTRKATIHSVENKRMSILAKDNFRCAVCKKKLKISDDYICKCSKHFCTKHRFPEEHNCDFDYKKEGKEKINKENPKVEKEKVAKF